MIYALLFLILFATLFPKVLQFLFALLFIGGIVFLGEVHAKPVQCFLNVNGKTYINKICDGDFEKNGSFTLGTDNTPNGTGKRNKYFVYMNRNNDGTMAGYWNGIEAESHASGPLGDLSKLGACWTNEQAKVCAWKIGERHSELDAMADRTCERAAAYQVAGEPGIHECLSHKIISQDCSAVMMASLDKRIHECQEARRIIQLGAPLHASELDKSLAMARQWDVLNNACRGGGRLGTGACAKRDKLDILLEQRGCTYIGYDAPIGKRDRYRCSE